MNPTDPIPPDRLPPQDKIAEAAVLGACLRDRDVIDDVLVAVGPEEFYYDAHQKVFRIIADLHLAGRPVDLSLLREELLRRKQMDDVGAYAEHLRQKGAAPRWEVEASGA